VVDSLLLWKVNAAVEVTGYYVKCKCLLWKSLEIYSLLSENNSMSNMKSLVAIESKWLLKQVAGCYGNSLGAKEDYGCNGMTLFLCESLVAIELNGCYGMAIVALESQ
jgi:hypothetical protein